MIKILLIFFIALYACAEAQPTRSIVLVKRPSITDNKEILLAIGDSNSAGTNCNTGPSPTPPALLSFKYNRSGNTVTAMGVDVVSSPLGTQYPQAIITYTDIVNKKIIVVPSGLGGSFLSNTGTNWSPSGTLYALAQSDVAAAISITGKKLKGIYICVSTNDVVNGVPLQDIYDAWDSLISRLQSDYPGVPICIDNPGAQAGTADARFASVRSYLAGAGYSNTTIVNGMSAMNGLGYMCDATHSSQTGKNYQGTLIGNWLLNLPY